MGKIKILLADDHPLIRKGIKSIIEALGVTNEILEANDGRQVIELSCYTKIDLFILDYRMPEIGGYETAEILLGKNPHCKIIIITAYSETVLISNLLKLGVRGFLSKNTNIEEIESAITKVLKGELYLSRILEERMQRELDYCNKALSPLKFSTRENALISLLSKGKTSKEISQSLELSPNTIETYRCRLLEKVGVKNTTELLHYLHSNGLV